MRPSVVPAAALLLAVAAPVPAQQKCPDGSIPFGVIGVGWYHCVGGICRVDDRAGSRRFEFTTEPRLRDITPAPSGNTLVDGDILSAVDGVPITLPAAGRRLGQLAVGDTVRLSVRRAGSVRDLAVIATAGCSLGMLGVTSDTAHPARRSLRVRPPSLSPGVQGRESGRLEHLRVRENPGSLGIAISCHGCGWVVEADERRWQAGGPVTVASVDPAGPAEGAGIRVDDEITHINGRRIDSREGSDLLADVRSDRTYVLRVVRSGTPLTVEVRGAPVPRAP